MIEYLGRFSKHFGIFPTKKLYEKSATFKDLHKPAMFALEFEEYLNKLNKQNPINIAIIDRSHIVFHFWLLELLNLHFRLIARCSSNKKTSLKPIPVNMKFSKVLQVTELCRQLSSQTIGLKVAVKCEKKNCRLNNSSVNKI
jgi:hypothetical protein